MCLNAEFSVIRVSRELFVRYIVIRLVVTAKRIVEVWYVKSDGGLATAPQNSLYFWNEIDTNFFAVHLHYLFRRGTLSRFSIMFTPKPL